MALMKDVRFVGSSLDDLKHFPAGARREAGFELSNVQAGLHAFQKKTRKTRKADIELAKTRYKALAEQRKQK